MQQSCQVLHGISIEKLKGVSKLPEISLDSTPLVAITGTNGSGKSTILHALACVYGPPLGSDRPGFKFPQFFLPTTNSTWQGSSFAVTYSYRFGASQVDRAPMVFGKANDRWTPRYERRPQREVYYIGIDTCVPSIERERSTSFLELTPSPLSDDVVPEILEAASKVLNRPYSSLSVHAGRNRRFRGVEYGGINYSSLSMGAGEQRVFEILDRVYRADKYSLILVDEIDLLMHEDALRRLITVINERASSKNLQVIFTTHRESLLSRDDVTVHHVFPANGLTMTLPATHPDVWKRLTGDPKRSLEIFVEDDLAQAVVNKVCADMGLRRHVETIIVGAASNLFTLAGGLALRGESLQEKLMVIDGDVYRSEAERVREVNRVVTGHGARVERVRGQVLAAIKMFSLPPGSAPEGFIHAMLLNQSPASEICRMAAEISVPMDGHGFVDQIVAAMGEIRAVALSKIVDEASKSLSWSGYVSPVSSWIRDRASALGLMDAEQMTRVSHVVSPVVIRLPSNPAPLIPGD